MKTAMKIFGLIFVAVGLVLYRGSAVGFGAGLTACGLYWMTFDWEER